MTHRRNPTVLEAVLRGKVAAFEDREDHLTGLVFGILAWTPVELGIVPLLRTCIDEGRRPCGWDADVARCSVELWPWWDHDDDVAGAEPDVAVELDGESGRRLLVVECKWYSGKSGEGERDQLMRQHVNGVAEAQRRGATFLGVLYLTTHITLPLSELADSRAAIEVDPRRGSARLGWASWRDLSTVLAEVAGASPGANLLTRLAEDVALYMRDRGLARFECLGTPSIVPPLAYRTAWAAPTAVPRHPFWNALPASLQRVPYHPWCAHA